MCLHSTTRWRNNSIVAIWVDDGLVASSSKQVISEIIQHLQLEFEIVSRPADYFVGLLINRDQKQIFASLSAYLYQQTFDEV